jgi:hypothetical protein
MFSRWFEREEVVKSRDAVRTAQGNAQRDRYVPQRSLIQVAEGSCTVCSVSINPRDWFPRRRMVASTRRQRLSRLGAVGFEKSVLIPWVYGMCGIDLAVTQLASARQS